jgi:hypothetical protein
MSMRKKIEKEQEKELRRKKTFEGEENFKGDTFARIYISMLMSKAWRSLTTKQHELYLYCKAQYYAEKKKPINDNSLSFTMNQSKWNGLYGLYTLNNNKAFYKDMTALIELGFVRCLQCGSTTRTKSIYEFSDKWQLYGTPEFKILPSEMTSAMLKKDRVGKTQNEYVIYRFRDKKDNIIYIGKTKLSLSKRINSHNHLPSKCYQSINKIEYCVFNNKDDMDIAEKYFISKMKPIYNTEHLENYISIDFPELNSLYNSNWILHTE